MSYAIPTNELTLTDIRGFKTMAIEAGIARALALGIGRTREELVVREANPLPDLGSVALGTGYAANYYVTTALVPGAAWFPVHNTAVVAGAVNAFTLARTQVAVFYKIADATANPECTGVRFRVGPTGNTTKASFFIQLPLDIKLESEVYLSEPVVYDPEDVLYIEFYPRAILGPNGEELSFGCFIVERTGATVS